LELDESSSRPDFFVVTDAEPVLGDELFSFALTDAFVAIRKASAKKRERRAETPQFFFSWLTLLSLVSGLTSANQLRSDLYRQACRLRFLWNAGNTPAATDVAPNAPRLCISAASCADALSCACGACALQFSLSVFF
jgi:hypothetical protein